MFTIFFSILILFIGFVIAYLWFLDWLGVERGDNS